MGKHSVYVYKQEGMVAYVNEKTIRDLEYDKIINMISERAQSSLGKKLCIELAPSSSKYEVEENLKETSEAIEVALKWGSLPLHGIKNIVDIIKKAKIGYTLNPG